MHALGLLGSSGSTELPSEPPPPSQSRMAPGASELREQLARAEMDKKEKLQILCKQQEERAKALETLNSRKEEQLVKLHNRLEEALAVLQEGQKMYATQQKVMDSQQETIERLCRSKPNGLEKPAPEAVPAKSGRDEARARAEAKAQVMRPSAQKQESPSPQSPEEDNEFLGMDTQQAEQVLAALQAMLAEKEQLHQQLLNEQADAERRLQALREMGSA